MPEKLSVTTIDSLGLFLQIAETNKKNIVPVGIIQGIVINRFFQRLCLTL